MALNLFVLSLDIMLCVLGPPIKFLEVIKCKYICFKKTIRGEYFQAYHAISI
jgi:hypothetical protein